jgi:hypothetical protein
MKAKKDKGQLFNFVQNSYLERTSRPIYAIIFLLPFIIFYEIGTLLINTDILNQSQVRVVAFVWLQEFLEYLGFASKLAWMAPPLAVVIILLAIQFTSRKKWYFVVGDVWPMIVECVLLAIPLIVLSLFMNGPGQADGDRAQLADDLIRVQNEAVVSFSAVAGGEALPAVSEAEHSGELPVGGSLLANIIIGIGAGIYEELVFRLILICLLMLLFQDVLHFGNRNSIVFSVLISAALFSAHHHIVFLDGQLVLSSAFNWTEFGFRAIAGVYFAVIFAIRGFGITAGTHAFYDTIAVLMNALFFGG